MSIIQSIIGSSFIWAASGWLYPPPGDQYPVAGNYQMLAGAPVPILGYYEASSLSAPTLGMWRRTFPGMALDGSGMDTNFPSSYSEAQSMADPYVGFGDNGDVNQGFTMEWTGYFKPTNTSNFVFEIAVDDYAYMWIGQDALTPTIENALLAANNSDAVTTGAVPLIQDKYYPVRIRYTENSGNHNCTVWSGWNGTTLLNNQQSAASGQFYYDNGQPIDFPGTGLII